jgi:excisionase family DNA binding protein
MGESLGRETMSATEVAEYLKLNRGTVYRLAREGKLPAARVGRAWRFRRSLVDRWIASQIMPPAGDEDMALAHRSLPQGKKVGIVTANSLALTDEYTQPVGWSMDSVPIAVQGIQGTEFVKVLRNEPPSPEKQQRLEALMIAIAGEFLSREPQIGALVFECTNLPPFSAAVREALHLPVFDAITLVNFAYQVVAGGRFEGYY